ncbi:unnamed protein product [Blumeria hordei]|uniref:Uncharacterized protein n=1 Tax=Blumeria hordei TaxID=2867405 RepID=A0A383UM43_BLUHO|nr:unnamed protein product [Blumeria hordei]
MWSLNLLKIKVIEPDSHQFVLVYRLPRYSEMQQFYRVSKQVTVRSGHNHPSQTSTLPLIKFSESGEVIFSLGSG